MRTGSGCLRPRLATSVVLLGSALVALQGATRAAAPDQPPKYLPIAGCGKAQAMALRFQPHLQSRPSIPGSREALAETDVEHYDLDIELTNINPSLNTCTITGTNVMTIRSTSAALTEFTFRLHDNYTITAAAIDATLLNPATDIATLDTTTRRVTLDQTYGTDEVFNLTISYTGNSVSQGFGSVDVDYQFGFSSLPIVVATLSEPYYANTWWPAKDGATAEPGDNADKFTMDFSVTVPEPMKVPSNGALLGIDTLSGNRKRYNWSSTSPIAPYLVSFAASDYHAWTEFYNHPGGSMPVQFYIYPLADSAANRNAWRKVLDMLPVFASLFGEYPFINEKYGIYSFNFGGGMEHQTMTGQGTFLEYITAHELAHQWWGDDVTCRTWQDIWLNEGFATYSECLWEEFKTGTPDPAAYFSAVQSRTPFSLAPSVYVPASQLNNLNRIFDISSSYYKGCWVLHMLRHVVGTSTFLQILADYRAQYQGSAATTDDFAAVASVTAGRDLTGFFDQWVYQKGAPNYEFGWQTVPVAGQDYLLVHIRQTHTGAGYPSVFAMPVDLLATVGGSAQTLSVDNDARTEWFVLPTGAATTNLEFDPAPWILRGSLTEAAYLPGPPVVVSAAPAPGEQIEPNTSPSQVTLTFHTPVNVSAGDFSVVGDSGGAQSFTIAATANVNPVVLEFASPLPPDDYTLTVADGVVSVASGLILDGEIADPFDVASLPSGDGEPGGPAVMRFTVSAAPVPGDCDGNGAVDLADFATFSLCFGLTAPAGPCDAAAFACSDLDADGTVNLADFATFALNFAD